MSAAEQETSDQQQVLALAARRAADYVGTISQRSVAPSDQALSGLAHFREPFPEGSTPAADVVQLLDRFGSPATVASTGGRYFGYVVGGSLPAAMGANWLAGAWDQVAGLRVMSPVAAELEQVVLSWICDALGLPPESEGGLVTCATMANFTALAAARYALLARTGWNVAEDGLFGAPPIEVVVGEEVHASILKALNLVGFGRRRVTRVEVDKQGRMRPDRFPRLTGLSIVCLQAGNVNTGAFDPAEELCDLAHRQGSWIHVDGAFGLWAHASGKFRHLTGGFGQADSWATDGHKWPNVNYDCGIVLVRDRVALRSAMTMSAAYLEPGSSREPMHHTPEASRRARGIELWAALKSLGRQGLCELVERTCAHAARFAQGLQEAGFEVLNEVVLNQVLVSFGSSETTLEVVRRVQQEGTCWCGPTVWQGRTAMRISVSSWATTDDDVRKSLAAITSLARSCQNRQPLSGS